MSEEALAPPVFDDAQHFEGPQMPQQRTGHFELLLGAPPEPTGVARISRK